ncbi:MAG: DUF116 domain-containing protein [Nanoarchaeota archaeon]|nr:DUF116 domain-containing protein [Nanoarchaeota archaeon]
MKIIFLPHCLRNTDCKAKLTDHGYQLLNCGKCEICRFKKKAEEKGYKVFIVPGASMIKKILKEYKNPELVIGVACDTELKEGLALMKKQKINTKGLKLLKDGCVNTEVDFEKLYKML